MKINKKSSDDVSCMLDNYHSCVRYLNHCGRLLANEFTRNGFHLAYANSWTHKEGNRVGMLFVDVKRQERKYISVPLRVIDEGDYNSFVRRYCKLGDE